MDCKLARMRLGPVPPEAVPLPPPFRVQPEAVTWESDRIEILV